MSRLDVMRNSLRGSGLGRWYYGRERSEQLIISGLAALIAAAILWAFVWKPISDWQTVEQNRQQNAQQLLDWMRANEQAARRAAQTQPRAQRANSVSVIDRAATAHDLTLKRLQPEANGVVSVILQQQSFNQIVSWVSQLEENNGISVERASFDSEDAPGYVNAQLRLN